MNRRINTAFLLLITVQALHSIEEYIGRLWEVFLPAKFVSTLVSKNPETGFFIINIGLFLFGIWCWLFPIRRNLSSASAVITFWTMIGLINGIGHPVWALHQRAYEPGLLTAPILLVLTIYLSKQLVYPEIIANSNSL